MSAAVSYKLLDRMSRDFSAAMSAMTSTRRLVSALEFKGQFKPRTEAMRPQLCHAQRVTEAISTYLLLACIPQSTPQILAGIQRGGYRTKSSDELASVRSALYRGTDTERFRRYGTKHWVLHVPSTRN